MFMMSPTKAKGQVDPQNLFKLQLDMVDNADSTGAMTARLKHIASLNRKGYETCRNQIQNSQQMSSGRIIQ